MTSRPTTPPTTRPAVAEQIGDFVARLRPEDLPEAVGRTARLHALDTLGCGLAALALGEAPYVAAAVAETGAMGPATGIGQPQGLPVSEAALLNGTLCHALDFDDTHPDSVVHVSAAVVPAALAAAQANGATGQQLLVGMVAGNEVSTRLGAAAGGVFHARGLHPTGVCGVFGAAAAAAAVRGLTSEQVAHTLGIAGSMASGLLEFLADGSETKRLHPGWAAQAGNAAARLAAHGATGPATVFEGQRGFFAAYLYGVEVDLAQQVDDLGTRWRTLELAVKPYPACHYTHAPVDALEQILGETALAPGDVARLVAFTDATGVGLVLEPAADKVVPRTAYDAKFSLPYCLAAMLAHRRLDVGSFTPAAIAAPEVLALTPKVSYELRQYAPTPDSFGGGVRVETTDGRTFEAELRYQRGSAQHPLSDCEIIDKYRANAALAFPSCLVAELEAAVLSLENRPDTTWAQLLGKASS